MKKLAIIMIALLILIIAFLVYLAFDKTIVVYEEVPISEESLPVVEPSQSDTEEIARNIIAEEEAVETIEPYSIAIFGLDTRQDDYKGRADMMAIVHVDHEYNEVHLMSFMRDLRVSIEGHGMTKLGHAYAYGREPLALSTINDNFDLDIKDYVSVNFEDVKEIVDILGGVTLEVTSAEARVMDTVNSSGIQGLNGEQVLEYARIRNLGSGDFDRTMRQRKIIRGIMSMMDGKSEEELLITTGQVYPHLNTSLDIDEIYESLIIYQEANASYDMYEHRIPYDGEFRETLIDSIYYIVIDDMEDTKQKINKVLRIKPFVQ